ncbi:MAG: gamma-glutamylcyclotransferase family protein [Anaerolineae bacterium]
METERLPVFVYGTLRPGGSAFPRIALFVQKVERAVLSGVDLYDLGAYPMALPGNGMVVGELLTLYAETYSYALHRLDRYEGYDARHDDGLYLRRPVTVTTADGHFVAAWTYMGTTEGAVDSRLIPSGDWLAR